MKPNGEGHPIYNVTVADLKEPMSITVTENDDGSKSISPGDTDKIRFEVWFRGQKSDHLATWAEFQEFLSLYYINPDSIEAAQLETGVPFELPDGWVRWIRVQL